jgi:hypothetical protein
MVLASSDRVTSQSASEPRQSGIRDQLSPFQQVLSENRIQHVGTRDLVRAVASDHESDSVPVYLTIRSTCFVILDASRSQGATFWDHSTVLDSGDHTSPVSRSGDPPSTSASQGILLHTGGTGRIATVSDRRAQLVLIEPPA